MERIFHESDADLQATIDVVKSLTGAQRKLINECIEHSGITRKKASAAAEAVNDMGLVFIRDQGSYALGSQEVFISASVFAEEAINAIEEGWVADETGSASDGVA